MIRFGTKFVPTGLKPEITCTFTILDRYSTVRGFEFILTSGIDREHMSKSLHHVGLAIDFTWIQFRPDIARERAAGLSNLLGPHYDVVVGDDHIHLEYQPKYRSIN
jgi:hypothetical protein